MKVLLFVQSGAAKPKCLGMARLHVYGTANTLALPVRASGHGGYKTDQRFYAARDAADRWWLVECESADDGRKVIACGPQTTELWMGGQLPSGGQAPSHLVGRVLASGAKGTP